MRLPDTPEMEKIWNEIEPYLSFSNEKGYEVNDGAPDGTAEKLEKYMELSQEQSDFARSLEN